MRTMGHQVGDKVSVPGGGVGEVLAVYGTSDYRVMCPDGQERLFGGSALGAVSDARRVEEPAVEHPEPPPVPVAEDPGHEVDEGEAAAEVDEGEAEPAPDPNSPQ